MEDKKTAPKKSTKKASSGIGFIPYRGLIALHVPDAAYPSGDIIMTPENYKRNVEEKAKELVNGELTVAATGEGVEFVKLGDTISLSAHSRVQTVETENNDEKKPLLFWWIIRESDILIKHDK